MLLEQASPLLHGKTFIFDTEFPELMRLCCPVRTIDEAEKLQAQLNSLGLHNAVEEIHLINPVAIDAQAAGAHLELREPETRLPDALYEDGGYRARVNVYLQAWIDDGCQVFRGRTVVSKLKAAGARIEGLDLPALQHQFERPGAPMSR